MNELKRIKLTLECPRCGKTFIVARYPDLPKEIFNHRCQYFHKNGKVVEVEVILDKKISKDIYVWKIVWNPVGRIVETKVNLVSRKGE